MNPPNLLLLLLLVFASTINAQFPATYCGSTGNFTANSTYQTTLITLLSSISTTNSSSLSYGFFNASAAVSSASQTLYVFGLCRGDLTFESCRACLDDLASSIRRLCPLQKEALLYTGNCIIRYSDASFFGTVATEPTYVARTTDNVSNPDTYDAAMRNLLNGLWVEAAGGGSLRKYASGNESAGPDMIYALVQCTPDLTEQQCSDCLVIGVQEIRDCCVKYTGGRFMVPSCLILYEINHRFFDRVSVPLPPSLPSQEADVLPRTPVGKSNSTRAVIIAAVTIVSTLLVIGIVVILLKVKRTKKQPRQSVEAKDEVDTAKSLQFKISEIRAATDFFSEANKLGEGGFGKVYQGKLENGQYIAVKRLEGCSIQGQQQFKNELALMVRLQHKNLIKLHGYCLEEGERLLILELAPNGSLEGFISDPIKRKLLSWEGRWSIIRGIARGLLYLHEDSQLRIIHRDLKPGNVLLDEKMNPKITDFGMARLFVLDQSRANTAQIAGTFGYMAPEYVRNGEISVKTDVYSFGVVVLEIISGKKNSDFSSSGNSEYLLDYAWKNWRKGTPFRLVDPMLNGSSRSKMLRCIHMALLCVQENVARRPTMASVILMLESQSATIPTPTRPAYLIDASGGEMPTSSVHHPLMTSVNEASMTDPQAR